MSLSKTTKAHMQSHWIVVKIWIIGTADPVSLEKDEFPEDEVFIPALASTMNQWSGGHYLQGLWVLEKKEMQPLFGCEKNLKVCLLHFHTRPGKKSSNNFLIYLNGITFELSFLDPSYGNGHSWDHFQRDYGYARYWEEFGGTYFYRKQGCKPETILSYTGISEQDTQKNATQSINDAMVVELSLKENEGPKATIIDQDKNKAILKEVTSIKDEFAEKLKQANERFEKKLKKAEQKYESKLLENEDKYEEKLLELEHKYKQILKQALEQQKEAKDGKDSTERAVRRILRLDYSKEVVQDRTQEMAVKQVVDNKMGKKNKLSSATSYVSHKNFYLET